MHFDFHSLQKDSFYTRILYRIQSITLQSSVWQHLFQDPQEHKSELQCCFHSGLSPPSLWRTRKIALPPGRLLFLRRIRGHRHTICWWLDNAYNFISQASTCFRHGQSFTECRQSSHFPWSWCPHVPLSHDTGRGCRPALSLLPTCTPQNQGKDDSDNGHAHRIWAFLYSLGLVPLICLNWWEKEKRSG